MSMSSAPQARRSKRFVLRKDPDRSLGVTGERKPPIAAHARTADDECSEPSSKLTTKSPESGNQVAYVAGDGSGPDGLVSHEQLEQGNFTGRRGTSETELTSGITCAQICSGARNAFPSSAENCRNANGVTVEDVGRCRSKQRRVAKRSERIEARRRATDPGGALQGVVIERELKNLPANLKRPREVEIASDTMRDKRPGRKKMRTSEVGVREHPKGSCEERGPSSVRTDKAPPVRVSVERETVSTSIVGCGRHVPYKSPPCTLSSTKRGSRVPCMLRLRITPPKDSRDMRVERNEKRAESEHEMLEEFSGNGIGSDKSCCTRQTRHLRKRRRRYVSEDESSASDRNPSRKFSTPSAPSIRCRSEKNRLGNIRESRNLSSDDSCLVSRGEQNLSMELQKELDSMDGNERVTLWHRREKRTVSGTRAPMRKNLHAFLRHRPEFDIFDPDGVHRKQLKVMGRPSTDVLQGVGQADLSNGPSVSCESLETEENLRRSEIEHIQLNSTHGPSRKSSGKVSALHTREDVGLNQGRENGAHLREGQCRSPGVENGSGDLDSDMKLVEGSHRMAAQERPSTQSTVWKEAERLRTDVFTVLGSLRVGDPVSEIRRSLETEIQRAGGFDMLVRSVREGKFSECAVKVLADLEELDVYNVVGDCASLGFPGFRDIREDLEAGRCLCVEDVWKQYCTTLARVLDFFDDGSIPFSCAERMLYEGGGVLRRYSEAEPCIARQEVAFLRMRTLCRDALERCSKMGIDMSRLVAEKCSELSLQWSSSQISGRTDDRDAAIAFIEKQQAFLTSKSNHRDQNGYSYHGKRQSAKVLSLSLYRPGFDGHRGEGYGKASLHESSCHCCQRHIEDVSSNALCCSNIVYGVCRKVFCFQCSVSTFGLSNLSFDEARSANEWSCYHCRSKCPRKSLCQRASDGSDLLSTCVVAEECRPFCILWHRSSAGCYKHIHVAWARMKPDGSYEDFGDSRLCEWDSERNAFVYEGTARVGAYRCKVLADDHWIASFSFRLTASDVDRDASVNIRGTTDASIFGWRAVAHCATRPPQRTCVRWVLADDASVQSTVDLPMSFAGGSIVSCSRTEGYDWRSAKLSPAVKWVGNICRSLESCPSENCGDTHAEVAIKKPIFPKPLPESLSSCLQRRVSVEDWDLRRNTVLYEDMRARSRWCIVTGRSAIHGIGLFTLAAFAKGDFIIEYVGELIRHQVGDVREVNYEACGLGTYLFKLDEEHIVDATMRSNRARFINHSCDPNMESTIVRIESGAVVIFVARRRIPPLAELTFNYQLPLEDKKLVCRCNTARCVGVMN